MAMPSTSHEEPGRDLWFGGIPLRMTSTNRPRRAPMQGEGWRREGLRRRPFRVGTAGEAKTALALPGKRDTVLTAKRSLGFRELRVRTDPGAEPGRLVR